MPFNCVLLTGASSICEGAEEPTSPPIVPSTTTTLGCQFESDFCGWLSTGGFTVLSRVNTTETSVVYASLSASLSAQATLKSAKAISLNSRTQLTFDYNVFDPADVVNVEVSAQIDGQSKKLWRLDGGPQVPSFAWLPARVSLCFTGRFTLTVSVTFR